MYNPVKLLTISRRRLEQLNVQKKTLGARADVSISIEIEDIQKEIEDGEVQLIAKFHSMKRRRHELELRKAVQGFNVDPAVTMEIEDITSDVNDVEQYFSTYGWPGDNPTPAPEYI